MAYKPKVIPVSFKTTDLDDKLLYEWLQDKIKIYGNQSAYIKSILRKEMNEELKN